MRLSVVIPAYNEERYLPACLESVEAEIRRSNGRASVEVLVVDNASTDRTAELAKAFPRVRVVHEPEKGLTRARQRGLREARGDVLAFVDADTRMPPGWMGRVLDALEDCRETVCVSGPYIYYDGSRFERAMVRIYWTMLATPAYWMTGYMVVGGNFAARREALERIGGFDTGIAFYGEDTNIARRLADVGKVRFSLRLPMHTSARRLQGEGLWLMMVKYGASFLSEALLKRPLTRSYSDIR